MKFCSECGTKLEDDAAFCPSCGAPSNVNPAPAEAAAPPFTPPPAAPNPAPVFTPPPPPPASKVQAAATADAAPAFTPPPPSKTQSDAAPVFTPPPDAAPVFTPPQDAVPIFTPPGGGIKGSCYYHSSERAVASCARCGKFICKDCAEAYGVSSGEYEGKELCYDCTVEMVANNVEELKKNKRTITFMFAFTLVGMLIGAIYGAQQGGALWIFVGAMIGGCFWTFLKGMAGHIKDAVGGAFDGGLTSILVGIFVGIILGFIIQAVASTYRTIKKVIEYIIYLKRTSGFIASDSAALEQMQAYMEYSQTVFQNKGVDLSTLIGEGGQLQNNPYAHLVAENGEAAADEHLRRCVTTIAENGEIIRSFAA